MLVPSRVSSCQNGWYRTRRDRAKYPLRLRNAATPSQIFPAYLPSASWPHHRPRTHPAQASAQWADGLCAAAPLLSRNLAPLPSRASAPPHHVPVRCCRESPSTSVSVWRRDGCVAWHPHRTHLGRWAVRFFHALDFEICAWSGVVISFDREAWRPRAECASATRATRPWRCDGMLGVVRAWPRAIFANLRSWFRLRCEGVASHLRRRRNIFPIAHDVSGVVVEIILTWPGRRNVSRRWPGGAASKCEGLTRAYLTG